MKATRVTPEVTYFSNSRLAFRADLLAGPVDQRGRGRSAGVRRQPAAAGHDEAAQVRLAKLHSAHIRKERACAGTAEATPAANQRDPLSESYTAGKDRDIASFSADRTWELERLALFRSVP